MATSQNGYVVHTGSSSLVALPWVTGRVVGGDVLVVFNYLCSRFNAEVEKITVGHSWGWAYRAIRGQNSGYSNHASGTAIDLNAPAHPLGKSGTFSAKQVAAIRNILNDLDGVIRWGGDYSGRKDEMHFEVNKNAAAVKAVANKIRNGNTNQKEQDDMFTDADRKLLNKISRQLVTTNTRAKADRKVQAEIAANAKRAAGVREQLTKARKVIDSVDALDDETKATIDEVLSLLHDIAESS